jgi:hypothetical protein
MFAAALKSFPPADKVVFVCLDAFLAKFPFEREARKHFPGCRVVTLPDVTQGQACTCLAAKHLLDADEPLLISSVDYQIVYDEEALSGLFHDPSVDVVIFTFHLSSLFRRAANAYAYCRVQGEDVVEIVEKRTISARPEKDHAVVGTFYYRCSSDFVRAAESMIAQNIRVNNEFYVGTSINQLIREGRKVRVLPVRKFVCFGTPFELELFQAWEEFFYYEPRHPYKG